MTKRVSSSRMLRVLTLRDEALEIIHREGRWQQHGFMKALCAEIGGIHMIHRTPFQKMPKLRITDAQKHYLAANDIRLQRQLPYGLDVLATRKVMNVEWDTEGNVDVVSFKPGQWEADLLAAANHKAA
jgi:hypothetical protein